MFLKPVFSLSDRSAQKMSGIDLSSLAKPLDILSAAHSLTVAIWFSRVGFPVVFVWVVSCITMQPFGLAQIPMQEQLWIHAALWPVLFVMISGLSTLSWCLHLKFSLQYATTLLVFTFAASLSGVLVFFEIVFWISQVSLQHYFWIVGVCFAVGFPSALLIVELFVHDQYFEELLRSKKPSQETQAIDKKIFSEVISVTANGHFIRAASSTGNFLIRGGFARTIARFPAGLGFRISRSVWVSMSKIVNYDERNQMITLTNGERHRVSNMSNRQFSIAFNAFHAGRQEAREIPEQSTLPDWVCSLVSQSSRYRAHLEEVYFTLRSKVHVKHKDAKKIAVLNYAMVRTSPEFIPPTWVAGMLGLLSQPFGTDDLPWIFSVLGWLVIYVCFEVSSCISHLGRVYTSTRFSVNQLLIFVAVMSFEMAVQTSAAFIVFKMILASSEFNLLFFSIATLIFSGLSWLLVEMHFGSWIHIRKWKKTVAETELLLWLPFEKRAALISISARGHHVEVTTKSGTETIRMKFSQALELVGNIQGLQIHRSHWISLSQISNEASVDNKPHVVMSDGRSLPVAKSKLVHLREMMQK